MARRRRDRRSPARSRPRRATARSVRRVRRRRRSRHAWSWLLSTHVAHAVRADHADATAVGAELARAPLGDIARVGHRAGLLRDVVVLYVVVIVVCLDEAALALIAPVRRDATAHLALAVVADDA